MSIFHAGVPESEELRFTRLKEERTSQDRRGIEAGELASNIRAISAANYIKTRSVTDNDKVNVFKNSKVLIITVQKNGQYSLQNQSNAGNSILHSGVSANEMSKENMMQAVNVWLNG